MALRAVFSEGRTLCVRIERPHECRGIPFPPDDEARGRFAYRGHVSARPMPSLAGVRSPPLRGMAKRWREGLTGANPEMTRKAVFSESALRGPTNAEAFHFHPMMRQEAGCPTGDMPRSSPCLPCGRAEPANPPCSPNRLSHQLPTPGKRTSWQQGPF